MDRKKLAAVVAASIAGAALVAPAPALAAGGPVGGSGSWFYLNDANTGQANTVFAYGDPGDEVYVADTDGDAVDSLLIRRGNEFFVRNRLSTGAAEQTFHYGNVGDRVLVGDWDGDGVDTLTVRRGNLYYVKNAISTGVADEVIAYGNHDDTVLVGDWDGDGVDTLAVRRGNAYFIKDTLASGVADRVVHYGNHADTVLVGNWGGETSSLGVRRGNTYYLKNTLASGVADTVFAYGDFDDTVLVGDWDGNGIDSLGVRRAQAPAPQRVVLDMSGAYVDESGFLPNRITATQGSTLRLVLPAQYDFFEEGSGQAYDAVGTPRALLETDFEPTDAPRTFTATLNSALEPGEYNMSFSAATKGLTYIGEWWGALTVTAGPATQVDVPLETARIDRLIASFDYASAPGQQITFTAPVGKALTDVVASVLSSSGYLDDQDLGTTVAADGSSVTIQLPGRDEMIQALGRGQSYYVHIDTALQPDSTGAHTQFSMLFDIDLLSG